LYLRFKQDNYHIKNNNIKTVITLPAVEGMYINGSGRMEAANFLHQVLTASINGSGYMAVVNSHLDKATFAINCSGEIKASSTLSNEAVAEIYGSGEIALKVRDKLKAIIRSSGNIDYWGTPASLEAEVTGSGKINKK